MTEQRPLVGVGAVIFRDEAVLMVRRARDPGRGGWSIPGGHLEWGETAAEAAAREVLEETGITAEITGFVAHVDAVGPPEGDRAAYHYVLLDFLGEWRSGEAIAQDDALDAAWMPVEEAAACAFFPETAEIIRQAAARRSAG